MKRLRRMLDKAEPLFVKGGRYERFHAFYEMVDTLFYSPPDVSRSSPHIRDAIDLKRVMIIVVFAATPTALIGMWNVGFQANTAMAAMGIEAMPGWRETLLGLLLVGHDPGSLYDNLMLGLSYFLPIYIVTMAAGGFWEVLFAGVRNHEVNEGFFVTSFLYALIELLTEKGLLTVEELDERKRVVGERLAAQFKEKQMGAVLQDPEYDKYEFEDGAEIDCESRVLNFQGVNLNSIVPTSDTN